jgi:hypothetical protein
LITPKERDCASTALQWSQVFELRAAIQYIRGWYLVHPGRIALFGHADGADISAMSGLFAALPGADLPGVQAAVLVSPGERSWSGDHADLKQLLTQSVRWRTLPLAILQPVNGESVRPTRDLADVAVETGDKQFLAALLPEVPNATPAQVQKRFATRAGHVADWAPLALRFIRLYGAN